MRASLLLATAGVRALVSAQRPFASRAAFLGALLMLAFMASTVASKAESDEERFNIMTPEPSAKKPVQKSKARRGSSGMVYPTPLPPPLHYNPSPPPAVVTPQATVPPPLYVPQTGRTLQNLPTVAPSGPKATETYQDRAVRCAHQAGVYGQAAGNRNAYVGSCINQ